MHQLYIDPARLEVAALYLRQGVSCELGGWVGGWVGGRAGRGRESRAWARAGGARGRWVGGAATPPANLLTPVHPPLPSLTLPTQPPPHTRSPGGPATPPPPPHAHTREALAAQPSDHVLLSSLRQIGDVVLVHDESALLDPPAGAGPQGAWGFRMPREGSPSSPHARHMPACLTADESYGYCRLVGTEVVTEEGAPLGRVRCARASLPACSPAFLVVLLHTPASLLALAPPRPSKACHERSPSHALQPTRPPTHPAHPPARPPTRPPTHPPTHPQGLCVQPRHRRHLHPQVRCSRPAQPPPGPAEVRVVACFRCMRAHV